ncbi:MAG: thiosulfate oxidation carrier protein SoxY [Methylococcaceae bacterium]|nr:thiosulfate oxidation carrier protein SoxY [Methylococcaceae bacterium]
MSQTRRNFLYSLLISLLALPRIGRSKPQARNFDTPLAQAMEREIGRHEPLESEKIKLEAPDIAEDGALVPITVESNLADVEAIWIFVEKNPNPLAARFELESLMDPYVSLRIKMNESAEVIAVIQSAGEYYSTRKKVRVVIGGCG